MHDDTAMQLTETIERLALAAEALENSLDHLRPTITATADTSREAELIARLEAAEAKATELEQKLADLSASAASRKTAPATTIAKQHNEPNREASSLDAALQSLSIEQRIAVKAELLRNGLL